MPSFFLLTRFSMMRSCADVARMLMLGSLPHNCGHAQTGASAMPTNAKHLCDAFQCVGDFCGTRKVSADSLRTLRTRRTPADPSRRCDPFAFWCIEGLLTVCH